MYYLILSAEQPIPKDDLFLGYTQSRLVVTWFVQNIHDIIVTEYKTFDDMWNDMLEQGLVDNINYMYRAEYDASYADEEQFEYPPVMSDDYTTDIAVDDALTDIDRLDDKKYIIHNYILDSDMKSSIEEAMEALLCMAHDTRHHLLSEDMIHLSSQKAQARYVSLDESNSYYLGEY